eukprot:4522047-Amphidinium_carterae.1
MLTKLLGDEGELSDNVLTMHTLLIKGFTAPHSNLDSLKTFLAKVIVQVEATIVHMKMTAAIKT